MEGYNEPTGVIRPPRRTRRFGALSLYYDGMYYFPGDIVPNENNPERPWTIQVVYYHGKWRQDTHYCTDEFIQFLKQYAG